MRFKPPTAAERLRAIGLTDGLPERLRRALDPGDDFESVPVPGQTLRVNVKVRRAGEVRIGLLNKEGRSVADCDPIIGDHAAHTVTWKGDSRLHIESGQTVSLRFRLRAADLFGFEWAT